MAKHTIISASFPEEKAKDLDALVKRHGYQGRSALLRAAVDRLVVDLEGPRISGDVLMLFTHDHADQAITDLRHEHGGIVKSHQHQHAGGRCIDIMLVSGTADQIDALIKESRQRNILVRCVAL